MTLVRCIDDRGLEGLIEYGQTYLIRALAVGAIEVLTDEGPIVCHGSRFEREPETVH